MDVMMDAIGRIRNPPTISDFDDEGVVLACRDTRAKAGKGASEAQ
jgi:hypothetical protein